MTIDPDEPAGPDHRGTDGNAPARRGLRTPHVSHGWRVGIRALLASLSLLVIVGSGVAWVTFSSFTASVPHGDRVPALTAGEKDPDGADQNVLLIGNDTRAGASKAELKALHAGHDTTTVNADTMMVLHIPANGSRASLVSFPRDSWVTIPGFGKGKINSAYPDAYNAAKAAHQTETQAQSAGIIQVIKTIHALTGLFINHYMQVSLLGFYRISNAIGGVRVCLNAAQNKTTEVGDGGHGNSGIDLPKGVSVIKGTQALAFVRQRHGLPHGDLDRIRRQQYFLKSAFTKIASAGTLLNPFKLRKLLTAVEGSLLTDPGLDLLSLARQLQSLTSGKITLQTIPNNGPKLIYPDGVETAIVEVNTGAIPAFIAQLEGKTDAKLAKATPAAPGTVTVDVLNGTATPRLAARNAAALVALGFKVSTVDSAANTAATTVEYPDGAQAQARAVLRHVPKAKAVLTPGLARVTLVLGTNGREVAGPGAPRTVTPSAPSSTTVTATADDGLGCID
ncbi:LCP family protein [uncultured Jatrophihabitans sp.]|uniref:LCP family protein n=1 Tax=uncultured Jatrophihabitans sp. TaxID=1610747 RepID=UPI0035CA9ADB